MLDHLLTTAGAEKFKADWETRPEFGQWLRGLVEGARSRSGEVAKPDRI